MNARVHAPQACPPSASWRMHGDLPHTRGEVRWSGSMNEPKPVPAESGSDFIRDIVRADLDAGRYPTVITRFPPEPNGYLHIGHAKSICLNFGIAREFGGICNIRMDDTNPTKEETEYVDSIIADVRWLIDGWADKHLGGTPLYASDYFDKLYDYAVDLTRNAKAYVDDMTPEQTDEYRRIGKESPFRNRRVEENLDSLGRMKLVEDGFVNGWDDPRMITIAGLRRRGLTANVLRSFANNIGVTKYPSLNEMGLLEHAIREEFNRSAERRLVALRPIKVVLTNYPKDQVEELHAINNPEDPNSGTRKLPFSGELFIDSADFMETPPPKYFRLRPGGEVRLKYAYIIKCEEVIKDSAGHIRELRCRIDMESKSGGATANRKVKGTIHWVSARHAFDAEVRLYDRLFTVPEPDAGGDFKSFINPDSLEIVNAKCEPSLKNARSDLHYQFERLGYFALDPDSKPDRQIWNRTITLKDTWAKEAKKK